MRKMEDIKTKIDPIVLHTLPFVPTRSRIKGYEMVRKWGDATVTFKAIETLNAYDLVTLLFMLRDYIQNRSQWIKVTKIDKKGRYMLQRTINLEQYAKERLVLNKKINRKNIFKSIRRLKSIDISLTSPQEEIETNYIFEVTWDKEKDPHCKICEVLVNQRFFDFCVTKGIVVILKRILKYKSEMTILLDVFIQGTKFTKYQEELLFEKIGLNETSLNIRFKRRNLKKIFAEYNKFTDLKFTYNKFTKNWEMVGHKSKTFWEMVGHKREIVGHKSASNAYGKAGFISI